jgi:hypothetical protein
MEMQVMLRFVLAKVQLLGLNVMNRIGTVREMLVQTFNIIMTISSVYFVLRIRNKLQERLKIK